MSSLHKEAWLRLTVTLSCVRTLVSYVGQDYRGCLGQSNQSILSHHGCVATSGKEPACQCRRHKRHRSDPCREDPLEKETGTHANILAWKAPWTEEPGGLQSTGLQIVGHDWSDLAHTHDKYDRKYCLDEWVKEWMHVYISGSELLKGGGSWTSASLRVPLCPPAKLRAL